MLQYLIKYIFILRRFSVRVVRYLIRRCDFSVLLKTAYKDFDTAVLSGPINNKIKALNYDIPVSFRNSLNARSYRAQNKRSATPEWILNNKIVGNKFADKLGLKRPLSVQKDVSYNELNFVDNTIIKPVRGAGSKGVYKFINTSSIYDLQKGMEVPYKQMKSELKKSDENFITEELILSSNDKIRDFKFFCFYGEVSLILEIERPPSVRYCVWDNSSNSIIDLDRYKKRSFTGVGVKQRYIDYACNISKKIPAPFVRIDFLHSGENDELYFGEFTPRPGGYEYYENYIDQKLGTEFVNAETRLFVDMLQGKKFVEYQDFIENLKFPQV